MEQLKQIYDMLEDEESKDIYINKVNYLITGKSCHLDHIIDICVPDLKRMKCSLAQDIRDRFPGFDVVIWGCGYSVQNNIECCKEIEKLICFCDRDSRKQKEGFLGFPVISPEELLSKHTDAVIVIGTGNYLEEIKAELGRGGIPCEHILNLGNYVPMSSICQYFEEPFLTYGDEEVFVDAGAFDLFSTMRLQEICKGRLKKAYAFEPDRVNFDKCRDVVERKNLSYVELMPYGTWDEVKTLNFSQMGSARSDICDNGNTVINTMPIDEAVKEPVTFIKMDVEGAELKSLIGARDTIRRDRPKLAISIYHKYEDMVQIPLYIKSLVPDYKLYVRHYSNNASETVLYAV